MKITDLLFELRRNPELNNSRLTGHAAAVQFLKDKDPKKYGVSMTSIPKLGINPRSKYNTPVGIYFYPAEFYLSTKKYNSELPFVDDAAYIQIFKLEGSAPDISDFTQAEYGQYIKHIYENIKDISRVLDRSEESTSKLISTAIVNAQQEAKVDTYGGRLWYIFYALMKDYAEYNNNSNYHKKNKVRVTAKSEAVVWNKLLRIAGFNIIVDTGSGIIHENEPEQGVVLDPRYISHVETIKNINKNNPSRNASELEYTLEKFKEIGDSLDPITLDTLLTIIDKIRYAHLKFEYKYEEIYSKLMTKIMEFIRSDPDPIYRRLHDDEIDLLTSISNNSAFKRELIIGKQAARYKVNFSEFMEGVRQLKEFMNSNQWNIMQKHTKETTFAYTINRTREVILRNIVKRLTPFVSRDKNAQAMVSSINTVLADVDQIKQMIAKT